MIDGSPPNLSISKMMANNSGYSWSGPAVAVCHPGADYAVGAQDAQDITCADPRILADFFRFYGTKSVIHGVRIASKGNQLINGEAEFSRMKIPRQQVIDVLHKNAIQPTSVSTLMDITPQQVETLTHFCRYKLCPSMYRLEDGRLDESEEEIIEAREKFVKTEICRVKFEEFFKISREKKRAAGESA
jgi:hypothetical protein